MFDKNVCAVLLIIGSALLFVRPAACQLIVPPGATDTGLGGGNAITGMVLAPSGRRLERIVSVRLQTMTRGDRVTQTDENGNFAFRGLVTGDYTVVIEREKDFEPFSQTVNVLQVRGFPPQTYSLNIRLTAKRSATDKPGILNADMANVPKHAEDLYNKAVELAKSGDLKGAVLQLQGAISEYPDFMLAYNEMGVYYLRLNDLTKADEALQAALKIDPHAYMPLMNRGIVLVTMKKYGDAEPVLRAALAAKESSPVGHYFLGQALANLGKFDAAEKELNIAIETGGDEMKEAHRLLAIIYSSEGKKKSAATELETYLRLAPKAPDAENLRKVIRQLTASDPPSTS